MTKDFITDTMKRTRAAAGIKDLRFHDLRHEATSRFFENTDLNVMEIKAITGHKTLQMLARYTHPNGRILAVKANWSYDCDEDTGALSSIPRMTSLMVQKRQK